MRHFLRNKTLTSEKSQVKTPPVVSLDTLIPVLMFFSALQIDADHIYADCPLIS